MAKQWTCKCGGTSVTKEGTTATASGKGWVSGVHGTHVVCHICKDRIQIGYELVWENRATVKAIREELSTKASTSTKNNGEGNVEFVDQLPGEEA